MARFGVGAAAAGLRLDHFLVDVLPKTSVHGARRLIANGQVMLDGRAAAKGVRVAAGQTVEVRGLEAGAGPAAGQAAADPSVRLAVLYQDTDLVAVDKPAGMASHPLRPGEMGTVANGLVALFPECAAVGDDPREAGLGHRLDRDTSGVLLAARSQPVWQRLRAALRDPRCEKVYLAAVSGVPAGRGSISGEIGRMGRRGARVKIDGGRSPLAAHTEWELLAAGPGSALVRARLHAGRAHQVRAHLAAAGHPILGDSLYGDAQSQAVSAEQRVSSLRLHAASIQLPHPVTGALLLIAAPDPAWRPRP